MSVSALITDLEELGIELGQEAGRIWYCPGSAMTAELKERMKSHNSDLLAMLRADRRIGESAKELLDEMTRRGYVSRLTEADELEVDDVPVELAGSVKAHEAELISILRFETASVTGTLDALIDPPAPCQKCGSLELWETLARNWRCLRCDPPTKSRRLWVADQSRRSPRMNVKSD